VSGDDLDRARQTMRRLQHEVRTPISQIVGYSELLEEELLDRGETDLAPDLQKIRQAAQRLLDLADGKLRDEVDPGAPVLPEAERAEPELPDARAVAAGEALRVLVVDDDANDRELLARRLERHGFRVDVARDGIEALRMIEADAPDVVLLEVLMEGMNGLEVLERLRRTRSHAELPIILATALDDSVDAVEGLARGANDYVTKPFDFPVVIARIQSQVDAHEKARKLARLASSLEFRSTFIREALGRELSDDQLVQMSERPDVLDLGREPHRVVAVVADVRGSRERAASLPPAQQTAVLKNVLDGLSEVVEHYGGIVEAVPGDSLVALFGLPLPREDDAERAVACGIALQLEMDRINDDAVRAKLPAVSIGVGVATGEVVVVGLGGEDHVKYKALGEPLVLAARIEAAAAPGEVWVCGETLAALGDRVTADREQGVTGCAVPAHRVLGVAGSQLISLRTAPGNAAGPDA
jgi:class 3 adenylate cyclase